MWTFGSPRIIVYGDDALEFLRSFTSQRILIVTDPQLSNLSLVELVKSYLNGEIKIFNEIEPEPSLDTAFKCAKFAKEFDPDLIVAIGGGSVLDVAKIARILMEVEIDPVGIIPALDLESLGFKKKAKVVTIPTTSGTGADATWAVVLTDKVENRKLTPAHRELIPDVSILDYRLVEKLPKNLIAGTGMDALCHAIEGLLSIWRNDFSDALCEKVVEMIFKYLKESYDGDMEARAKMHIAATMAGLGFGNSQVGLAHALGHSFGAIYKLHHGLCVGMFLPYVMQYFLKHDEAKSILDNLSRKVGFGDAEKLIDKTFELMRNLNVPIKLSEVISKESFEENLENLTIYALNDASIGMSPRVPEYEEVKKLYLYSFEGNNVDF